MAGFLAAGVLRAAAANAPDFKYGLYIYFGISTFAQPNEAGEIPAARFAPTSLDIKGWVHTAKQAGTTFAVLTAKHHSGVCLWASQNYNYDIAHSRVKTDIIPEFIAAGKAEGILPGAQYALPEAHNDAVSYTNPVSRTCFELVKKHITELHTKYPDLRLQVWSGSQRLNAAQAKESSQIVHRLNPQCIVLDNNHEMHATVIKGWMWTPTGQFFSAGELFKRYAAAGTAHQPFLLNVGIDPSGHIPDHQVAVLMDLKNLIAQKAAPTAAAAATPDGKPDAGERLKKLKSVHAQGLINQEDYDRKVKEIMDSL